MTDKPRLIECAFPLKQTLLDSVHEKNVRHGHISISTHAKPGCAKTSMALFRARVPLLLGLVFWVGSCWASWYCGICDNGFDRPPAEGAKLCRQCAAGVQSQGVGFYLDVLGRRWLNSPVPDAALQRGVGFLKEYATGVSVESIEDAIAERCDEQTFTQDYMDSAGEIAWSIANLGEHRKYVTDMAFVGEKFLVSLADGEVYVWDVSSKGMFWRARPSGFILDRKIAVSQGTGRFAYPSGSKAVAIWELSSASTEPTQVGEIQTKGASHSFDLSPDGRWLATTTSGELVIWDTETGKPWKAGEGVGNVNQVTDIVRFRPTGELVHAFHGSLTDTAPLTPAHPVRGGPVTYAESAWVRVYKPGPWRLAKDWGDGDFPDQLQKSVVNTKEFLQGNATIFGDAATSPDGRWLALGSGLARTGESTVWLWHWKQKKLVGQLRLGSHDGVTRLVFSPSSRLLAIGRYGGGVWLAQVP